ncbi:hypothetical protein J2850_005566 [Azospirillum picis]|uniref:Uncharacterized protein n=1 Tax=Azospirillum picis TaxID=488438 RepID=A0ABU0MSP5_9PROT|nr:hypothetical protein [Azospirillum picis]MDQ0536513.1 hypothetical protein [Azospirillum picis]
MSLLVPMLGLGAYRTYEKVKGWRADLWRGPLPASGPYATRLDHGQGPSCLS